MLSNKSKRIQINILRAKQIQREYNKEAKREYKHGINKEIEILKKKSNGNPGNERTSLSQIKSKQ